MHFELSGKTRGINTATQMKGHFLVDLLVLNLIVCQTKGGRRLKGTLGLHIRNEGTKATLSSEAQASHIFYCSAEQYCFTNDGINVCNFTTYYRHLYIIAQNKDYDHVLQQNIHTPEEIIAKNK